MDDAGFVHSTGGIGQEDWRTWAGWCAPRASPFDPEALHAAAADFEVEHLRDNMWSDMPAEVPGALGRLQDAGYRLAVISNAEPNLRDRISAPGSSRSSRPSSSPPRWARRSPTA